MRRDEWTATKARYEDVGTDTAAAGIYEVPGEKENSMGREWGAAFISTFADERWLAHALREPSRALTGVRIMRGAVAGGLDWH